MSAEIKALAIRRALELGAGAVRVTSAQRDRHAGERMSEAFRRGDFSCWPYDDEYARRSTDPTSLLARSRSVICIAVPYATAIARDAEPLRGRVSNYAWSTDYHSKLWSMLAGVAEAIDAAAGEPSTAIACDTRPLAERALAARAGLGWIGKHTNLIAPKLGSFVFLGEIVTTLELPPDDALRKSCGACVRCVDVCPTRALRGDYTIDANRCISDLTQRRGTIPLELRALIGDWVWGCDLCQLVCPPTRRAGSGAPEAFAARDQGAAQPRLVELLQLDGPTFDARFRATAMGWRGAAVLRRNAAVALGNCLDRSAVEPLIGSLQRDRNRLVRGHAAWALGRIGSPRAVSALLRRSNVERDAYVQKEITMALQPFRPPARSGGA